MDRQMLDDAQWARISDLLSGRFPVGAEGTDLGGGSNDGGELHTAMHLSVRRAAHF